MSDVIPLTLDDFDVIFAARKPDPADPLSFINVNSLVWKDDVKDVDVVMPPFFEDDSFRISSASACGGDGVDHELSPSLFVAEDTSLSTISPCSVLPQLEIPSDMEALSLSHLSLSFAAPLASFDQISSSNDGTSPFVSPLPASHSPTTPAACSRKTDAADSSLSVSEPLLCSAHSSLFPPPITVTPGDGAPSERDAAIPQRELELETHQTWLPLRLPPIPYVPTDGVRASAERDMPHSAPAAAFTMPSMHQTQPSTPAVVPSAPPVTRVHAPLSLSPCPNPQKKKQRRRGPLTADALADRRAKHNQIEIRRRQRVAATFDELRAITSCDDTNKGAVLQAAIDKVT